LDLENEVENLGMQLYATAKREHFGIFAKCHSQDVPKGRSNFNFAFKTLGHED